MKLKSVVSVSLFAALSVSMFGCNTQSTLPNVDSSVDQNVDALASKGLKSGDIIPGEYIVKFKKSAASTNSLLNGIGAKVANNIGGKNSGLKLVKFNTRTNSSAKSAIAKLEKSSAVEYVEANRFLKPPRIIVADLLDKIKGQPKASAGEDPMFAKQWHHKNINTKAAWTLAANRSSKKSTIAILDTGIDAKHSDLKAQMKPGFDAYGKGQQDEDLQGHGTHCAGIAAATANNGIGVAGVSNNSNLISVKVLGNNGSGSYEGVANGVMWAANNKNVDVMSMSLGGPSPSKAIAEGIALAIKNGKTVPVASGNDGNSRISYPAGAKGAYTVGATDINDKIARFSQFGSHLNISAPGVNILSTFPRYKNAIGMKDYGAISGTSMATPAVAGLAGLLKSLKPSLKGKEIEKIISSTANDAGSKGFDKYFGNGIINVQAAVAKVLGK